MWDSEAITSTSFCDININKAEVFSWNQQIVKFTLWLFNIAMENGPFIDDFTINTSIYKGFSMAMLNNQMVTRFLLGDHPHRHRETEAVVKQCMVVALTRTVGKHYKARPGNLWELD